MNHRIPRPCHTVGAFHNFSFLGFQTLSTVGFFIDMVELCAEENVDSVWPLISRLLGDASQYRSEWAPVHHFVLFQRTARANQNRRRLIERPFQDELVILLVLAIVVLKIARMTVFGDADGDVTQTDISPGEPGNTSSDTNHQGKSDVWKLLANGRSALSRLHSPHLMRSRYDNLMISNTAERINVFPRAYGLRTSFEFFVLAI